MQANPWNAGGTASCLQILEKSLVMHQSQKHLLSARAYEKPLWQHKSQRSYIKVGACPKSLATPQVVCLLLTMRVLLESGARCAGSACRTDPQMSLARPQILQAAIPSMPCLGCLIGVEGLRQWALRQPCSATLMLYMVNAFIRVRKALFRTVWSNAGRRSPALGLGQQTTGRFICSETGIQVRLGGAVCNIPESLMRYYSMSAADRCHEGEPACITLHGIDSAVEAHTLHLILTETDDFDHRNAAPSAVDLKEPETCKREAQVHAHRSHFSNLR